MRSRMARFAIGALVLFWASAAPAQDNAPYNRALAAGYKASFLCSNIFNGGMTEAQTEADDLKRTYPELGPIFPTLTAEVDRLNRMVRVPFAEGLPPRIAVWHVYLGCTQLPIGATQEQAALLPRLAAEPPNQAMDGLDWPMGDRRAAGRLAGDPRALEQAMSSAFDRRTHGQGSETTAVLIVQNGRIVAERYRDDINMHTSQRTWSVAKSIAGTVIGAAVQQRLIDVDAPAPIPEWQMPGDPRRSITTDQLLRMASGLHSDFAGNRTDALYFGGTAITEQAASFPIVAPAGTRFRYANNDIVLAIRGLQYALGDGEASRAFPFTHLFWKLGMTRTVPETDWRGHFVMSSQVWTTARDLARLGLLHLNDGMWNGERILPQGWRDYVRRNGPAQPPGGPVYGASWWTFPAESGLPADSIVARGNRGQFLVVIPSRNLVIVRRGFDGTGMNFDIDGFTKQVLAALR